MSLFLASGDTRTLPTVIWPQVRHAVRPDVAAASGILLAIALAVTGLALAAWRGAQRHGRHPGPPLTMR
jgi:ABC-type spermidine/putrescine transport system permease subunit II